MKIIECVPNFSEGLNQSTIDALAAAVKNVSGAHLLHVDSGIDANRTVITFAGEPEPVIEAAFQAVSVAVEKIDMRKQRGVHARLGAADVVPIIPVANISMQECVQLAKTLGRRVGDELGVPVYLYEDAASRPERRNLADIRRGEYEGLADKMREPDWRPDFGPATFNPATGATVIGARNFLIAYNVNLKTTDRLLASEIAATVRESGRVRRNPDGSYVLDETGQPRRTRGRLDAVKAIGWYIEEYDVAQVSMNITNYHVAPIHKVYETVKEEAEKLGILVNGSELIGLMPLEAMLRAGRFYAGSRADSAPESELVDAAIRGLGLDDLARFDPNKKILDYLLQQKMI